MDEVPGHAADGQPVARPVWPLQIDYRETGSHWPHFSALADSPRRRDRAGPGFPEAGIEVGTVTSPGCRLHTWWR